MNNIRNAAETAYSLILNYSLIIIHFSLPPQRHFLEQATGIEPALSAWEAEVLPLNYACVILNSQRVFLCGKLYFNTKR